MLHLPACAGGADRRDRRAKRSAFPLNQRIVVILCIGDIWVALRYSRWWIFDSVMLEGNRMEWTEKTDVGVHRC